MWKTPFKALSSMTENHQRSCVEWHLNIFMDCVQSPLQCSNLCLPEFWNIDISFVCCWPCSTPLWHYLYFLSRIIVSFSDCRFCFQVCLVAFTLLWMWLQTLAFSILPKSHVLTMGTKSHYCFDTMMKFAVTNFVKAKTILLTPKYTLYWCSFGDLTMFCANAYKAL